MSVMVDLNDRCSREYRRYHRYDGVRCPQCRAKSTMHSARSYAKASQDAMIFCDHCDTYIGVWDLHDKKLIYNEERFK